MSQPTRPNIVFVLCDNTGWGDFSCYGGSTPTPRIDRLAGEGMRFTNYTVESQCTPTRSAILTGRQSVRSGTFKVPLPGEGESGLSPWEYTIAELLSDAGYATSLWGKWHLGEVEGRLPTDQGFDEWWGYKNSVDEAGYTSYAAFRELVRTKGIVSPKIWEGKRGQKSAPVCELDLKVRPFLDELIVGKATDYIKRAAESDKPFFTYVGLSNLHPPAQVHPDFDQTDPARLGMYAELHCRDGLSARADRGLRGWNGDRQQHYHHLFQRQRGRDDQCRSSSGRIERSISRWVLYPAVGGLDAGPYHRPLFWQGASGRSHPGDALGA